MNPYATGLAPVAASAIGRGSGLMNLLKPLDYPRQAVANAGQSLLELLQGQRSLPGAMMGMAPALAGGAMGAMMGNPFAGLALGGGALQGALGATGMEEFEAPTPQDISGGLGMGNNMLGTAAVNMMIDPLTYLGLPGAARGFRAPVDEAARGMGLAAPPSAVATDELRRLAGMTGGATSEVGTLGMAEDLFGNQLRNVDEFAAATAPGGEMRFGSALDPNVQPSSLQAMLAQAQDPRMPFVGYTPEAGAMLPNLGPNMMTSTRVSGAAAPDVMELLGRTNQSMMPPQPGGRLSFAGEMPPGLETGRGGWARVGAEGIPPQPPQFQMGELPADLLRPSPAPSLSDLALGTTGGRAVVNPPFPASMGGINSMDLIDLQKQLAGIGQGVPGTRGFQHVTDLPLDEALAVLARERGISSSNLQQLLQRSAGLPPDQQQLLRLMSGMEPGAAPLGPANLAAY